MPTTYGNRQGFPLPTVDTMDARLNPARAISHGRTNPPGRRVTVPAGAQADTPVHRPAGQGDIDHVADRHG